MNRRIQKKRQLKTGVFMGIIFIVAVFFITILNFVAPDREFSNRENRLLQLTPSISGETIADGTFMKKFESYLSDQFAFRDFYMRIRSFSELTLGSRESNGVYYGSNGYLFEKTASFGVHDNENREAVSNFAKKHEGINMYMMIVPNSVWVMSEKLPKFAPVENQREQIEQWANSVTDVNFIDICDKMRGHQDEYIYYRTDHHWTTLGAKYAFESFAEVAEIEYFLDNYKEYTVKTDFSGTLESKSGYMVEDDTINVYIPSQIEKVIVTDSDTGKVSPSLYDSTKLSSSEPYAVFLGGNSGMKEIETMSDSGRNILIFKDSYANCFIPFLTPYFSNIYVVDPRYYYGDVEKIMTDKNITDVLFLYNANTLFEDSSLYQVIS